MKRTIIIGSIILVTLIAAGVLFFISSPATTGIEPQKMTQQEVEKKVKESEDFDKQFQNTDGTVNKAAVSSHIDKEISIAESEAAKFGRGTPEREKADRRVRMLKAMKEKMQE
ncbi:MAG: hypothetical protein WC889_07515 [Myxococcota bacterium]|jgi:preprotein translocase subunit SecF